MNLTFSVNLDLLAGFFGDFDYHQGISKNKYETDSQMITRISSIILAIALVSTANAGLRVTQADGTTGFAAGTSGTQELRLLYVNDTGASQTVFGFDLLNLTLSSNPFGESTATTSPTLANSIVDVTSTPWEEFGGNNGSPLGAIGFSSPFGLTLDDLEESLIGTFEVDIPAGFLGELILSSTDPLGITATTTPGTDGPLGPGLNAVGVGEGTVVPEPSSFLFLGLVGTGMIGFRRMRRSQEELVEAE